MATILVADDRPLNRQYLVTLLGYFGHRLVEACDGEEALRLAKSEHPDLVITDLVMPNVDGEELAARLHADPDLAAIPILFHSATYSVRQAREVARQVGAFGVLPKPSDPETIVGMVNDALGLQPQSPEEGKPVALTDWSASSSLIEMSLELAAERDPAQRLQGLAHLARKLIGAKYAEVGLLSGDDETVEVFLSSGSGLINQPSAKLVPSSLEQRTIFLPRDSILRTMMRDRRPLLLNRKEAARLCRGIPVSPEGSNQDSVLAVPFVLPSALHGWLLLVDKLGAEEFADGDALVVSALASLGASAYERAEERLRAEEDLRKSKAMFETLFEAAPDAMLTTDADGTITYLNAQTEKMFGYQRGELAGRSVEILIPERFRGHHGRLRQSYHREPRLRPMGTGTDLYGRRSDGSEFPVDIMLSPMHAAEGRLALSVIRDITVRKQNEKRISELNQQLQARVEELEVANQSLEGFSYSVSHDLRTPLRAINGFAGILLEEHRPRLDEEAQRLLDMIAVNCRKMGCLIDDLLSFSRITRADIQRSEVDMTVLAHSVVDELRALEPARRIEVTLHPLPPADADRAMLRQVLANLVSNAWKFTRHAPDASVEIGSYKNGTTNVYFVKDNGAGFNPQYSHKLFGVFERLHTDQEFEGTGIGLAIVRRIVQRHGGEAWAQGNTGEGATFFFQL